MIKKCWIQKSFFLRSLKKLNKIEVIFTEISRIEEEKKCLREKVNGWEMHYAKSNFSKGAATRIGFYTSLNLIVPILMANIGNAFIDSLYPTLTGQKAEVSIPWAIYGDSGMIQTMVFVFWFEAINTFPW